MKDQVARLKARVAKLESKIQKITAFEAAKLSESYDGRRTGMKVTIIFHTADADGILHTRAVRETIGAAFDTLGVEEEIDYTLRVEGIYG